MKHLRTLSILIAALWGYTVAHAEKVEIDGIWYNLVTKAKQAEVTFKGDSYDSYTNEYSGSVTIPSTVVYDDVEYIVTSIGGSAFRACNGLTSIAIPENSTLTSIGDYAFYACYYLASITMPEYVTSIGDYAFSYCRALASVTIPEGVTTIGRDAFAGCTSLTSITIPTGVTTIEKQTLSGCSALTSITIPEGVTSIGERALSGCSTLTSVNIPASVRGIGVQAFGNCSGLISIAIPESVTSISEDTFTGCSSLSSIIIPENSKLTSIGARALSGCRSLASITIPEGVTSIGNYAFSGCSKLAYIVIFEDSKLTSIGNYAFNKCSSLTSVVLPSSLQSIGSSTFANCSELVDVYCYANNVPETETSAFNGSYPEYATLHVPTIALESYKNATPWNTFGTIVSLDAAITSITLSESSATLAEGESLTLTIITDPENADRNLISWSSSNSNVAAVDNMGKVTAVAPGTATITVTANDGSGVGASCEVTVKEKLLGKCDAPMVNYTEGKVVLTCSTEEVEYVTSVVPDNELNYQVHEFDFIPTYTFNVYATKAKYENSDVVSVTICWIDCAEEHASDDDTGILAIPSQPVLIQSANGVITLTGLADGTAVEIYNLNGMTQGSATAVNGTATITTSLEAGSTAIVKIGKRSVKVMVK